MFALLAVVILWFAIIVPLKNARAEALARIEQATLISAQISSRAETLRRITRTVPRPLGTSLAVAVAASATEAGFTPTRLDRQGDDRVLIAISSAKSPALFAWLDTLSKRGIFAEKITVRPNSDATVSCEATFRLRGRGGL